MADTPALVRIYTHCQAARAKLLLAGDHRQLVAVGAAGGMDLVAAAGARHEQVETRRLAEAWEGAASLRLRQQDPNVLAEYHKPGRLLDDAPSSSRRPPPPARRRALEQSETAAARTWLADTLTGQ